MNYSINIDHIKKIIRLKHSGCINDYDIMEAWKEFLEMKEFKVDGYSVLSDYRNGKFNIKAERLLNLVDFFQHCGREFKGNRQCMLVDDPYTTAISLLFKNQLTKKAGFIIDVFSTETAAVDYLVH